MTDKAPDAGTVAGTVVPIFSAIDVTDLPTRGAAGMSEEHRATAQAVTDLIATGKAAKSNAVFDTQRKAYDAGSAIVRNIYKLALHPVKSLSVRGILVDKDQYTFAIAPAAEKVTK